MIIVCKYYIISYVLLQWVNNYYCYRVTVLFLLLILVSNIIIFEISKNNIPKDISRSTNP